MVEDSSVKREAWAQVEWWNGGMMHCKHAADALQVCCRHAAACLSTNRVMIINMIMNMNIMKLFYFFHAFC